CLFTFLLNTKQKIGRDEELLNGEADTFLEGITLLLRHRHEAEQLIHFRSRRRSPKRPAREAGDDAPHTGGLMPAVEVPTDENLTQAFLRCAGCLVIGSQHVKVAHHERGGSLARQAACERRSSSTATASTPCTGAGTVSPSRRCYGCI